MADDSHEPAWEHIVKVWLTSTIECLTQPTDEERATREEKRRKEMGRVTREEDMRKEMERRDKERERRDKKRRDKEWIDELWNQPWHADWPLPPLPVDSVDRNLYRRAHGDFGPSPPHRDGTRVPHMGISRDVVA